MTAVQWLKELYDAHYTMLYRLAANRLLHSVGNMDDVQDVLQDVFRLALEKNIRSHPNPIGWLIKATENTCKNYARRRVTDERRRQDLPTKTYVGETYDPSLSVKSSEDEADIQMLLESTLTKEEQQIIIKHYQEKRSVDEIAQDLGITSNALNVRIYRIRKRLQKILSEYM